MEFITYSLTNLIVFLGLGVGIALAYIAPEEMKDGKKYFIWMQNVILSLVLFFLLYFYRFNLMLNLIISLALFFSLFFYLNHKKKQTIRYVDYAFLGIMFYLSAKNTNLFLLLSSLMFIYGLPTGSLLINIKKKNVFEVILNNVSFVVISLVLFLLLSC